MFSTNFYLTNKTINALNRLNIRVPEDVSVVGFDNIVSKFYLPLMLSSVSSSKTNMSVAAVDMLMDKKQKKSAQWIEFIDTL